MRCDSIGAVGFAAGYLSAEGIARHALNPFITPQRVLMFQDRTIDRVWAPGRDEVGSAEVLIW